MSVCVVRMLSSLLFYTIRDNSRAPSNLLLLLLFRHLLISVALVLFNLFLFSVCLAVRCCCSNVLFTCLPALKCLFFFVLLFYLNQVSYFSYFSRKKMSGLYFIMSSLAVAIQIHSRYAFSGVIVIILFHLCKQPQNQGQPIEM